ncbi:MAG: arsenate reductase family protein [Myxococcota bacterium]|jgi:arsenate reductase|nr:arsenate reductase family protein [Myxococcota bacterium]
MKFYHYPNCSSCKKAKKWLESNGVEFEAIHLVDETPDKDTLQALWEKSGLPLKKFFNTSGGSYRALDLKNTYDDYSDEERLGLLADDGMLIKRPLLDLEDTVLVGFKESAYEDALG